MCIRSLNYEFYKCPKCNHEFMLTTYDPWKTFPEFAKCEKCNCAEAHKHNVSI